MIGVRPMLKLSIYAMMYQVFDYAPKAGNTMSDWFKFFACGSAVGPNVDIIRISFQFDKTSSSPWETIVGNDIERYQITNTPI